MPSPRFACIWICLLAACSSPGPAPDTWAQQPLPAAPADATLRQRVAADCSEARLLLVQGQQQAALRAAEAILARHPWAATARAVRARVLAERATAVQPDDLAGLDEAEGELLLARRSAPEDLEIRLDLAWFLARRGLVAAAAAELDQLLQQQPAHREALRQAARLHFELGRERRCAELCQRLLALEPGDVGLRYRLAWSQLRLAEAQRDGDLRGARSATEEELRAAFLEAEASFDAYRKLAPADLAGLLGSARAAAAAAGFEADETKQALTLDRALSRLREADRLAPKAPSPQHSLAVIEASRGRLEQAQQAYETALQRQPDYLPSLYNLALLAASRKDPVTLARCRAKALAHPQLSPAQQRRLQGLRLRCP